MATIAPPARKAPRTRAPLPLGAPADFARARCARERLGVVFRFSHGRLVARAQAKVGADGEELVQDVYAMILRHMSRPEAAGLRRGDYWTLHAYLRTTLERAIADFYRRGRGVCVTAAGRSDDSADGRTQRRPAIEHGVDLDTISWHAELTLGGDSDLSDVEERAALLAESDLGLDAREAIGARHDAEVALDERERTIRRLRTENPAVTQAEIAEAIGSSQSSVSRLEIALAARLKGAFGDRARGCDEFAGKIRAYVEMSLGEEEIPAIQMHVYGRAELGIPDCARCKLAVVGVRRSTLEAILPPPAVLPLAGGLGAAWRSVKGGIGKLFGGGGAHGGGATPVPLDAGSGTALAGAGKLGIASGGSLKLIAAAAAVPVAVGGGSVAAEEIEALRRHEPVVGRAPIAVATPPAPVRVSQPPPVTPESGSRPRTRARSRHRPEATPASGPGSPPPAAQPQPQPQPVDPTLVTP